MENISKFRIIKCKQNWDVPFSFVNFFGLFKTHKSNFIYKWNIIITTCLSPIYSLSFKISQFCKPTFSIQVRFS